MVIESIHVLTENLSRSLHIPQGAIFICLFIYLFVRLFVVFGFVINLLLTFTQDLTAGLFLMTLYDNL